MGEIGAIMARLEEEGLNLEQLIDRELQEVGFLSLATRSKDSLSDRIDAVSENQTELKALFKSIEDQLRLIQEQVNIPENVLDGTKLTDSDKKVKHVIVIDDDEDTLKTETSCQAEAETTSKTNSIQTSKLHEIAVPSHNTTPSSVIPPTSTLTSFPKQNSSKLPEVPPLPPPQQQQQLGQVAMPTPLAPKVSSSQVTPLAPKVSSSQVTSPLAPKVPSSQVTSPLAPNVSSSQVTSPLAPKVPSSQVTSPLAAPHTSPLNTPFTQTTSTPQDIIAYRTLKSPCQEGQAKSVVSMVTVKSSHPVMPEYLRGATAPTTPSVSTLDSTPVAQTRVPASGSGVPPTIPTVPKITSALQPIRSAPPVFKEGTRIIGKRSDDLWYPGVIVKVQPDRSNQTKFRVKFDQGNRGLLRSNHIALESHAPKGVLDVGSRIVALRPRETADEGASWRQEQEGPYGKLDVLYAGIVAEKSCTDTKNRFLIFFDDGFAQYLPLSKLHHVYHTGDKVWNEVAEHSQEFIQEYLEEFPNRPMVVLKANQWVKTEWRGKWLKAKVMQVDCSLVKMLFQIDNRTEWIYRGSTRLEPLFKALVDGKISQKKSSKKKKQAQDEPYVDFSATKTQFGLSTYSKTDPKGLRQQHAETMMSMSSTSTPTSSETSHFSSKSTSTQEQSLSSTSTPLTNTLQASIATQTSQGDTSSNATSSTPTPLTSTNQEPQSALITHATQTQNLLAVKALKRMANKIHEVQAASSRMASAGSTTVMEVRGAPRNILPLVHSNALPLPDNPISPSWTTNNYSPDFTSNNYSSNHYHDNSTASIIHASTMRKRTSAGLHVNHKTHLIDGGPSMVLSATPNGVIPKIGPSPKKMWEAPWKRTGQVDTLLHKESIVKTKFVNSKHDAAALIQERLQAHRKMEGSLKAKPELRSLVPKPLNLGPHKCGQPCGALTTMINREEKSKHNVLALPLLLHWKREISRRHPKSKKEIYYRAPCNRRLRSLGDVAKYLLLTKTCNVSIDQFCFDPEISCSDVGICSKNIILADISQGQEPITISVANDQDKSVPPDIDYVSDRILSDGVHINTEPGFLACCDCTDNCQDKTKCSCAQLTISASAAVDGKVDNTVGYEYRRLMDTVPTGIYECNQNCACSNQCFNRVVQNGIQLRLQVFKTENRGWGLRTLDDIPIGAFICTYSGQIMNEDMANKEGRDFGDEYLAELDHIEVVEKIKEGYESSVSDVEDDSVIYKTLETGNSSDQSETGSVSGYGFVSDSDSDDSNSSHSSYSPRAKKSTPSKKKQPDPVKITEADGTTFSVTMADEKCVMAISSGKSVVLRRLGESDQTKSPTIKQENHNEGADLQKDPPPMPKPTIIDLTSGDDDDMMNYSTNNTLSDPSKNGDNDIEQTKKPLSANTDSKSCNSSDSHPRAFTDFKFFDLTEEDMDTSDVINGCHDSNDVNDDVSKDDKTNDDKDSCGSDTKSNVENKMLGNDKNVELIEGKSSSLVKDSSVSKVSKSVSEATKQETMAEDPCLRKEAQQPSDPSNKPSSSLNAIKNDPSKISLSNDHCSGNLKKEGDPPKENNDLQGNDCHDNKDSLQGNSCRDNKNPQVNSSHNDNGSLQDKRGILSNDDASRSHDDKDGNQEKKSNNASDRSIAENVVDKSMKDVTRESNLDNSSQGNNNNDIDDKSRTEVRVGNNEEPDKQDLSNDVNNHDDVVCDTKIVGQSFCDKEQDSKEKSETTIDNKQKDIGKEQEYKQKNNGIQKDIEEKDNQDKNIQNSDIQQGNDVQVKNILDSEIQEKDIQHSGIEESDVKEKNIQDRDFKEKDIQDRDFKEKNIEQKDIGDSNNQEKDIGDSNNQEKEIGDSNSQEKHIGDKAKQESDNQDSDRKNDDKQKDNNDNKADHQNDENAKDKNENDSNVGLDGDCSDAKTSGGNDADSRGDSGNVDDDDNDDVGDAIDSTDVDAVVDNAVDSGKIAKNSTAKTDADDENADDVDDDNVDNDRDSRADDKNDVTIDNDDRNDNDDTGDGVTFELRMEIDDSMDSNEAFSSSHADNTSTTHSTGITKSTKRTDSVPSLMSADDLSKLAAKIHQPYEEPPTLTKMDPAQKLTADLHDTIAKLQSRGVAPDNPVTEQPDEDSFQSFDDLPLFPSGCDSFPPSPASSRSGSWISDSLEKSSDGSNEANSRNDRLKNDGRRARRFIVTLQKSGLKRSASPDGIDGGPYKRPSTRSLFNNEEHCYVIDAKAYGNCGRFLNHSCSPNLFVQNVFINTHDLRFPHVAFFAQHNILAGSELTWDYMYEVGSVQDKVLRCYCGSSQCRGRLL